MLARLVSGAVQNVAFSDLHSLVTGFGFELRGTSGSHHIYSHSAIPELINLQDVNGQAKPYQVREFAKFVERYNLEIEDGT